MANPNITGSMALKEWSALIPLSTTTTENVLANAASSGQVIEIQHLSFMSDDSGNSASVNAWVYDQDGTGMNSNTGAYEAAIGADVVAGSAIGLVCPEDLAIAAAGGQVVLSKENSLSLLEDQSLVVQASAANDIVVVLRWIVKG